MSSSRREASASIRRPKFHQTVPGRNLLEKPEQHNIKSRPLQSLQPFFQIPIQLLVEVTFHAGDQCPKFMDDTIQFADCIFRNSPIAAHVLGLQFFYRDIHKA